MEQLRVGARALSASATSASTAAAAALDRLEGPAQAMLLVALGIVNAEEATADGAGSAEHVAPNSSVSAAAAAQLCRLHANNRLLASSHLSALPLYCVLLQAAVSAHYAEIEKLKQSSSQQQQQQLPSTFSSAPSGASAPPTPASSTGASTDGTRNPFDLFTRPASYWRTDRLLRQTLCMLHALLLSNRHSGAFVRAVLRTAYLPAVLMELLSAPLPRGADVLAASTSSMLSTLERRYADGSIREDEGEFVVQYGTGSGAEPSPSPRKAGSGDHSQASAAVTRDPAAVDPSSSIASPYWRRLASESFGSGKAGETAAAVRLDVHVHSVSFLPLVRVSALLSLVLDLVHNDVLAAAAPQQAFAPAQLTAAAAAAAAPPKTASAAAATPKSARASVGSAVSSAAKAGASPLSSPAKPARPSSGALKSATAPPKSPAAVAKSASSSSAGAADSTGGPVFCVRCLRAHCCSEDGGSSCARACPRTTRVLSAVAAAAAGGAVARSSSSLPPPTAAQQGALLPFQLQQLCDVLAIAHGAILYAPELVPASSASEENDSSSDPSSSGAENDDATAAALREAGRPLLKHAALPVTRAFPFVVANASLPSSVCAQLSALALHVIPVSSSSASSSVYAAASKSSLRPPSSLPGASSPSNDASPLRGEEVVSQLLPGLERGVGALARLLLTLSPGFDPRRVMDGSAPAATMGAAAEINLAASNGAAAAAAASSSGSFIDLRQMLLTPTSLIDASDALLPPSALAFFARRQREVLLASVASILHLLRLLFGLVDGGETSLVSAGGSRSAPCGSGAALELRYLCSLYSQAGLAALLTKNLSIDLGASLARQTESNDALTNNNWSVLRGELSSAAWGPSSSASSASGPTISSGFSTRLLVSLTTLTSLLRFVLDGGSSASGVDLLSASTLLSAFVAFRLGVRRVLARLMAEQLLLKESVLPALVERAGGSLATKEALEAWRMEAALCLRAFDPFLTAAEIKAESAAPGAAAATGPPPPPLARARTLMSKHPSHSFHAGCSSLLFRCSLSPWSDLASLASSAAPEASLSALQHSDSISRSLRLEAGLAARGRFPYGDAAALPLTRMPSTGMTMSPGMGGGGMTSGGGGGGGGGILPLIAPVEPPTEGSGIGIVLVHPSVPPFAQALLDDYIIARNGGQVPNRRALALEALDSLTRTYPAQLDQLRLEHERRAKIDRLLALPNRVGSFADTNEDIAREFDTFAPLSYVCAAYTGSTQPPARTFPAASLGVFHALACADLLRRFHTEERLMRVYGLEKPLVEPSLAHRPTLPAPIVAAQAAQRRERQEAGQAERILAAAIAPQAAQRFTEATQALKDGGPATSSAVDYFAHPFLTRTTLTPRLLSTVLSPPPPPTVVPASSCRSSGSMSPSDASAGCRFAGAAALASGRIELDDDALRRGYAQLIATANFD
jgi:hypothetical protein